MNKLTNLQGQQLIELIREKPCLYDKTDKNYKQAYVKKQIWKEIADKIGVHEDDCKTAWKSLRDQFVKCKREIFNKSRRGSNKMYKYYHQLSFLKKDYTPSKRYKYDDLSETSTTMAETISDSVMTSTFPGRTKEELRTDMENTLHEFVLLNQRMYSTETDVSQFKKPKLFMEDSSYLQANMDQFFLSLSIMVRNAMLSPSQTRQIQRRLFNTLVDELNSFGTS